MANTHYQHGERECTWELVTVYFQLYIVYCILIRPAHGTQHDFRVPGENNICGER